MRVNLTNGTPDGEEYDLLIVMGVIVGSIEVFNSEWHRIILFGKYNEMRRYFLPAYYTALKLYNPLKNPTL